VETEKAVLETDSERKHITVLFSDLSGYTAITERLDPENVKEIMSRVFGEIVQVVTRYEGFIEKLIGDAAMILFGVPKVHADDPVRAIRTALEINQQIEILNAQLKDRVESPLRMHSGINTGLVVTGEMNLQHGTHGITGDTINVASRLESLAKPGEILVGPDTYAQTEGYFNFESLEPTLIKGKTQPIRIYKVQSPKAKPSKIRRVYSVRADHIGRKAELAKARKAIYRLRKGKGTILSVCGVAGAGKSRLVDELKAGLDLEKIRWREGHADAYSQNIPYSLFIDLLNHTFQIKEGDSPDKVRDKVKAGVEDLVGEKQDIVTCLAGLFSLSYQETDDVGPETWKRRLHNAIYEIINAMANQAQTVVCLEDLHWSDPSSLELIHFIISEFRYPLTLICVHRPSLKLFSADQLRALGETHQEIQLQDLSQSDTQIMVQSLLNTEQIPSDLGWFVQEKVGGNPFYLEEVIHSLIESEALVRDNHRWMLKRPINEFTIPPTIHGVISERIDRLDKENKRILQEASVIGKAFFYEILKKITELKGNIDHYLSDLESLDLIKTRTVQPDREYLFKHALTQEVGYSGLLIKERKAIHERIGLVMEQLFNDRLVEFYEALAFHFKRGRSIKKAVGYLAKSGEKSLRRYALEESHRYYQDAFEILINKSPKSNDEEKLFIDLLNQWSFVYYYRGRYKELLRILTAHKALAESLADAERLGMFYAWLGCALWHREMFEDAYQYTTAALKLGEETKNNQIIGYACAWLTWICTELGLMDEAIICAERAQKIYEVGQADQYIYFNSLAGMGYTLWHKGERRKTFEVGQTLLDFGQKHSDPRSMVMGNCCLGWSYLLAGDLSQATFCFEAAVKVSTDPWYSVFPKLALCYGYISYGKMKNAEALIHEILEFSQARGAEFAGTPAYFFHGVVLVANGDLSRGVKILEEKLKLWSEKGNKLRYVSCGFITATIYAHIAQSTMFLGSAKGLQNFSFLIQKAPFASRKASKYFSVYIEAAKEIGAKGILGQAYLNWGFLHKSKGKTDSAKTCFTKAVEYFEQCEANIYLAEANEALNSL
jgi:class 3 adenylate cyclase/tetratricopeptide (TPR) repeat protein